MLPPRLEEELPALRERFNIDVHEDPNFVYLVVHDFPVREALYNRTTTTLLIQVPRPYPDAGLDMFWTEPELALKSGSAPQAAEVMENHLGRQWRRFSWHPQFGGGGRWDPNVHNLDMYLAFISKRFESP